MQPLTFLDTRADARPRGSTNAFPDSALCAPRGARGRGAVDPWSWEWQHWGFRLTRSFQSLPCTSGAALTLSSQAVCQSADEQFRHLVYVARLVKLTLWRLLQELCNRGSLQEATDRGAFRSKWVPNRPLALHPPGLDRPAFCATSLILLWRLVRPGRPQGGA